MARKQADKPDMSDEDKSAQATFREMGKLLGRAVSLSCVAAVTKPGSLTAAQAIEAMDKAWVKLVDKIIEFAMEDNVR